jgi:subfamily B ATP-binding cassette protein MsbA
MTDVEGVRNLVGTGLVQLFGGILTSVIAFGILIYINPMMTLFAVLPLLVFGVISLKAFAYIRPIFRKRGAINAEVTGRLTESLGGIRVIKGFNAETQEISVFQKGVDRLFQNVKKSLTTTSLITSAATLLLGITSVLIMGVGGNLIMQDKMSVGDLFAFTLYLGFLIAPIVQMSNIGSQITEAFAGLDRMEEILSLEKEGNESDRIQSLEKIEGNISFENVSFSYEEGKEILHNISFKAPAGSVTALVGTSGSGKTTIAGLAASFIKPDSGVIYLDKIDLKNIKLESYRSRLGVVLQDDFLFEGTIKENILFPKPEASEKELDAAVDAAHVREFTDRFDDGLDTLIGERGIKLSGGQRQRVAIARALLANPQVLILDEATSNLDTESELFIQESLSHLMEGRTTFVIAHRLSTIRRADQILVIEDGKIAEQGTHDKLIKKEGRYYQLYTYQARI